MKGEGGKTSAHLKCMYTNEHSMGNKQEELEDMMKQENYDVVALTETWWDVSHDWSVPIDGYKLFRRDRQGRRGGGVALYVRDCLIALSTSVVKTGWSVFALESGVSSTGQIL